MKYFLNKQTGAIFDADGDVLKRVEARSDKYEPVENPHIDSVGGEVAENDPENPKGSQDTSKSDAKLSTNVLKGVKK